MNPSPAVYLDHNATTRPAPEVVTEMRDALETSWGNPSSLHAPGQAARRLLSDARVRVASFLGCKGSELVFTSGANEANHMAVLGAQARGRAQGRSRLVLSAVEHPGLLALSGQLQADGVPVDLIPVDAQGRLDLAAAAELIGTDVALVSVMGANNETGVLMPTAQLAALAQRAGTLLHVDATQLAGKSTLHFGHSGADLMSVSAHKFHGPKGVGALLLRQGLQLPALLHGRQERYRRGGTENLPGIVGFAAACERAGHTLAHDLAHVQALRQRLEQGLLAALPEVHVYGRQAPRLGNTLCLRFGLIDHDVVLTRLERAGVLASSGAACSAGGTRPSHVMLAMGEPLAQARASVRFSLGRDNTPDDIEHVLATVQRVIAPLLNEPALAA
ncbi:MAG TPA: cysteine desulfurase family protein [Burkholderiaceae bacterium]|nr:cysteine desulfurase family protein [Burkholderiaceae bacterium]